MTTEVAGELEERDVFFADGVDDSDGGACRTRKAENGASRASELALKGLNGVGRRVEVLFVESLENVHAFALRYSRVLSKDNATKLAQKWLFDRLHTGVQAASVLTQYRFAATP